MELGNFPQYLDALERTPRVMDLGTQIGHGALRAFVMGERGAANESATDADIEAMAAHVEESIRAGALGFSTSRTPIHRSKSGELVPGTHAEQNELLLSATQSNEPVVVFFNLHQSTSDSLRTNGLGCANFLDAHPMSLSASTSIRQMKSQISGEMFSRFLTLPTMTT